MAKQPVTFFSRGQCTTSFWFLFVILLEQGCSQGEVGRSFKVRTRVQFHCGLFQGLLNSRSFLGIKAPHDIVGVGGWGSRERLCVPAGTALRFVDKSDEGTIWPAPRRGSPPARTEAHRPPQTCFQPVISTGDLGIRRPWVKKTSLNLSPGLPRREGGLIFPAGGVLQRGDAPSVS